MDKWTKEIKDIFFQVDESFVPCTLTISYDIDEGFPVSLNFKYEGGETRSQALTLDVKVYADRIVYINEDLVCLMSNEQRGELLSVEGIWEHKPLKPKPIDIIDRIPKKNAKDFGIVYFYLDVKKKFVHASFFIDFDWSNEKPIMTLVKTYNDSLMPDFINNAQYDVFDYEYLGEVEGLYHCAIGTNRYLFNAAQLQKLKDVVDLINKK